MMPTCVSRFNGSLQDTKAPIGGFFYNLKLFISLEKFWDLDN